jgi:hypothetical protein
MSRFRETCRMTRRPLQWLSDKDTKTEQCLWGDCMGCDHPYLGYFMFSGHDMWANKYSLCNTVTEDQLMVYGTVKILWMRTRYDGLFHLPWHQSYAIQSMHYLRTACKKELKTVYGQWIIVEDPPGDQRCPECQKILEEGLPEHFND